MISDADRLDASLIYMVGRVNQGIRRLMRDRLADTGLSISEYTALSVLRARPNLSNAQLARRALVTPQAMITILAELERRGLVVRREDPAHARILRAELTAPGAELLASLDPAIAEIQDRLLGAVPRPERAAVLKGMRAAMQAISDGLGDAGPAGPGR